LIVKGWALVLDVKSTLTFLVNEWRGEIWKDVVINVIEVWTREPWRKMNESAKRVGV